MGLSHYEVTNHVWESPEITHHDQHKFWPSEEEATEDLAPTYNWTAKSAKNKNQWLQLKIDEKRARSINHNNSLFIYLCRFLCFALVRLRDFIWELGIIRFLIKEGLVVVFDCKRKPPCTCLHAFRAMSPV